MRRVLVVAVTAASGFALAWPAGAQDGRVRFACCAYDPADVRVEPGEQVVFEPASGEGFADHPLAFEDPAIAPQRTGADPAARRFERAGTYRFFCEVHGAPGRGMAGVVHVGADPPPATTTAPPPAPAPAPAPAAAPAAERALALRAPAAVRARTVRRSALAVVVSREARVELRRGRVLLARATGSGTLRLQATAAGRRTRPGPARLRAADGRGGVVTRPLRIAR